MKKLLTLTLGLLLTSTVLIACGNETSDSEPNGEPGKEAEENNSNGNDTETTENEPLNIELSEDEAYAEDQVVLEVNGEEITGKAYNTAYMNTKRYLLQNNQDISDEDMLKKQTIQTLKNNALIEQDAKSIGINITEKDVETALEETKTQFETETAFQDALDKLSYTEESYKQSLKQQLLQQKYLEKEVEVRDVTDEEIKEYYGMLKEQSEEIPPLEEIKPQISSQLKQSNIQKAFQEKVTALIEKAEIDEKI